MNQSSFLKKYSIYALLVVGIIFAGCSDDDDAPPEENLPEIITDVTLVFTSSTGAEVRATAQDPDGLGVQDLVVQGAINLSAGETYTLTYEILNALDPADVEDVLNDDIAQEKEEHQIFYSFTDGAFTSPAGDGNIDNAADPVNYGDTDANGNPVGLETTWTTASALSGGTFTARLQHQPDVKTATSTASTGDTDFNLTFVLNIQ